jgi:hypothetical protein
MVYACSGVAVRHWHANIRDHHRIFVTSARLAQKFNDNRTRDDNLRVGAATRCFLIYFTSFIFKLIEVDHSVMLYYRLKCILMIMQLCMGSWDYMMKILILLWSHPSISNVSTL